MKNLIVVLCLGWIIASGQVFAGQAEDAFAKANSFYNQGNFIEARQWYRQAAEQDHAMCAIQIGADFRYR
ncbi:MAG: hypothetical protein R3E08_11440 [Thiotrichaceae bacterium]